MEFENGTWTSYGPEARAKENEQRVEELKAENKLLKQRVVDLQNRLKVAAKGSE